MHYRKLSKHYIFFFINPWWLLQITFLIYFQIVSSIICSTSFPGIEDDQSVAPQVLFHALLEDWKKSNVAPVLRSVPWSWPFKAKQKCPCNDTFKDLQHLGMHLIRSQTSPTILHSYPQAVSINLSLDLHKNGNNHFPTIVFRLKTVTWSARPLSSCQVVYYQLYGLKSLINVTGRHPFLSQWGGREGWVSNVTVIIILLSLFCLMLRHRFIKLIWYAS